MADVVEPGLFGQHPAARNAREEAPAVVLGEFREIVLLGERFFFVRDVSLEFLPFGHGLTPRRFPRGVEDIGFDELLGFRVGAEERPLHVGRQAVDDFPFQASDERQVVFLVAPVVILVVEERGLRRGVVTLDRRSILVVGVHRRRVGQGAGEPRLRRRYIPGWPSSAPVRRRRRFPGNSSATMRRYRAGLASRYPGT